MQSLVDLYRDHAEFMAFLLSDPDPLSLSDNSLLLPLPLGGHRHPLLLLFLLEFFFLKTSDEALASLSTFSGVRGYLPTLPLIPSVPNNLIKDI